MLVGLIGRAYLSTSAFATRRRVLDLTRSLNFTGQPKMLNRRPLRKLFRDLERKRLKAKLNRQTQFAFPRFQDGLPFALEAPRKGGRPLLYNYEFEPLERYRARLRASLKEQRKLKRKEKRKGIIPERREPFDWKEFCVKSSQVHDKRGVHS